MKITFNLQEGFKDDKVIIFNKDKKIYEAEDVSTRTQIGLAKSFECNFKEKNLLIRVNIPTRNVSEEKKLDADKDIHIGISIEDHKKIVWKTSEQPFMYM